MTGVAIKELSINRVFPRMISVVMIVLLLLLTTMNYFIYPGDTNSLITLCAEECNDTTSQTNPAGPDEKSPNSPVGFNEEYVHRQIELQDPHWTNHLFEYLVQCSEKLDVVHFEILSPPPEQAI
jgi:hypothetical protein